MRNLSSLQLNQSNKSGVFRKSQGTYTVLGPLLMVSVNYNFGQRDKQKTTWAKSTAVLPLAVWTDLTPASSDATACVGRTAPLHHVL